MLPIKSKYKIAKRLGARIFEQTQTQKFALSEARFKKTRRSVRGMSDYGRQLLEKQRVRFTYGLTERQLYNYAHAAYEFPNPAQALHEMLEMRADSIAYHSGLSPTRRAARQAISHGHFAINGRRVTVPSYRLRVGDTLAVREGSRSSSLFGSIEREPQLQTLPPWLKRMEDGLSIRVITQPQYSPTETPFDYAAVFEFYSR